MSRDDFEKQKALLDLREAARDTCRLKVAIHAKRYVADPRPMMFEILGDFVREMVAADAEYEAEWNKLFGETAKTLGAKS